MEKIEILKREEFEFFLKEEIRKIIFIGGSDTGKTTLIKDVANFLFKNKKDVYIFDCDVGQSHVGPPTTIGYAKLKEELKDDFYLKPDKFYFVGAVAPSFSLIDFLTGVIIIDRYIEKEKGKILIDTTGYIRDKIAISLKINKIEILKPDFVILLERENELEEIIEFLKLTKIGFKRIKVENLPSKNMEDRANYRKMRFLQYFQNFKEIFLNLENLSIKLINFKNLNSFSDIFNMDLNGFLCSLKNDDFEDITLGIIKERVDKKIKVIVPSEVEIDEVKGITISSFLLNFSY